MKSHKAIIREVGAANIHAALSERGVRLSSVTPQRWADRNNIPGEYWQALAESGLVSLDALAVAADKRVEAA